MRIFGWAADQEGCGFYRMGLPLNQLGLHGHDTQVSTTRTGFEGTADVIVGQRVCNSGPAGWWAELGALPTSARPALVYELDDDLWGIHPENDLAYDYFQDQTRRRNMVKAMAASDMVTVTNENLAEVVRNRLTEAQYPVPMVRVIPNAIPESLFSLERPYPQPHPILGYAGSGTHRPDFQEVAPQVYRFLRRNPDVEWHAIGVDYLEPGGVNPRRHTPWTPGVENYYRTVDFTVGLAPLAAHPFNLSKSPLKALEYGAMGIPVVASNFGPYADYVAHGQTGYLVNEPHEWGRYLYSLFSNPGLRARMGTLARRQAMVHTIESQWTVWERAYEEAASAVQ